MGGIKGARPVDQAIQTVDQARADSRRPSRRGSASSLLRRGWFLGLALALLVGAVATQARLGTYAATGGGAAQVSAPPGLVALSLAFCLGLAVLLSWLDLRAGGRALLRRWTALPQPHTRPPMRARFRLSLRAGARSLAALRRAGWPGVRRAWRGWLCAGCLLLAVMASGIADLGARTDARRPAAQWWWLASATLLLVAAVAWEWQKWWAAVVRKQQAGARASARSQQPDAAGNRQQAQPVTISAILQGVWADFGDLLLLLFLLAAALELRLPGLTDQPYVVHGDEAACGLEAMRWLNGGVPSLISTGWYGLPVAGYGIPALVMRVAGANLFGLRLSSVLLGVASIALLYALTREFAGRRVAFVAAALLTITHIFIHFSRMGIHYIHAPFVVLLTLWLLVRSLRANNVLAAMLAGVGLSLAMQVYFSARILFLIFPLFLLGVLLLSRQLLKGRVLVLGWLVLSFLVSFGPMGIYFLQHLDALNARSNQVLILNLTPDMRAHLVSQFGTADFKTVLLHQLAAVPLLAGGLTDQSFQYGPLYPMFDALVAALVTVGFFYALLHLRRPLCLLLIIWVGCTVIVGGVLTIDMPWWPRLLVMVPALCLLAALALEALLRSVQRAWLSMEWMLVPAAPARQWRALALGCLLALLVIGYSGSQSIQHYFSDYPRAVNGDGWRTAYTDIGRYMEQLPASTQVILFSDDSLIWDYSTFQFLAPQVRGQRVDSPEALQTALSSRTGPVLVIITPGKGDDFQTLMTTSGALPPGQYLVHAGAEGQLAFFTYRVSG
jgi:4-amino-4-deoxy-L-arabinose transferase-like glycosyltransferase